MRIKATGSVRAAMRIVKSAVEGRRMTAHRAKATHI
jgi:hypothetical protein